MGALNILRNLQAAGVVFSLEGGAVRWRNGGQHMTSDRLAALQADKTEVVAALTHRTGETIPLVAIVQCQETENPPDTDEASPYSMSAGGNPKTWTGKVVSLAEWRALSEWERHGSTGKVWNGLTQQWEAKA
jgi:hypothetical protein